MNKLVVLDTNVIISAAISKRGPPQKIIEDIIEGEIILLTCQAIIEEYWDVVHRPKFQGFGLPPIWLEGLILISHFIKHDPHLWPIAGPDPDDCVFLSLALEMGAILVTGNIRHFPTNIRNGVTVLTPAEYVSQLSL